MQFHSSFSGNRPINDAGRRVAVLAVGLALIAPPVVAADFAGESGYRDGELIEQIIEQPGYDLPHNIVCGQSVDDIVLFEYDQDVVWVIDEPSDNQYIFEELETTDDGIDLIGGVPTIPARTPMFYCITGETLLPNDIPPPPEYCCY